MSVATDPGADRLVAWLGLSLVVTGLCMLGAFPLLFAWGVSLTLTLCLALGARRNGRLGAFKPWLIAALGVWIVAFGLMHAANNDATRLWLGFTEATAASVYLLWPAPFLLVTLPYALLFDRHVLSKDDWAAIERFRGEAGD